MQFEYVFLLLLTLVLGIVIGVKLRSFLDLKRKKSIQEIPIKHRLQLLFDSYSDDTIEKFINSLDVSSQTLPLHISIGKHFRTQGEVEKAILIHQNLMSHPELSAKDSDTVIYELAKDYKAAGLFDRALALFQQLSDSKPYSLNSIKQALDIFESEKDWESAITEAKRLNLKKFNDIALRVAHYYCELANIALINGNNSDAEQAYLESIGLTKHCYRASIGLAKIAIAKENYSTAISYLKQVVDDTPENTKLILSLLLEVTLKTNTFRQHQDYLKKILASTGQISVLMAIIESMKLEGRDDEARSLLIDYLQQYANLFVLKELFDLGVEQFSFDELKSFVDLVLENVPKDEYGFKCRSCGFSGRSLLWLCPSCKSWQTIQPVIEYE